MSDENEYDSDTYPDAFPLGAIHKLCRQNFEDFDPPSPFVDKFTT